VSADVLASQVSALAEKVAQVLTNCRTSRQACEDLESYLDVGNSSGIKQIFQIMPAYVETMSNVGVTKKKDLEALWGSKFANPEVRDSVEDLLQVQEEVEAFLRELEVELAKADDDDGRGCVVQTGDFLPGDLAVTDVALGSEVSLGESWRSSAHTLYVFLRHFG